VLREKNEIKEEGWERKMLRKYLRGRKPKMEDGGEKQIRRYKQYIKAQST
jgi:hypothetical protein